MVHLNNMDFLFFIARSVEESWPSQTPRRPMGGYTCVWRPTWSEKERVKKRSSRCLVRRSPESKGIKHYFFFLSHIYCILAHTVFITQWKAYLLSMLCLLPTSRKTSVCAAACEPGGLSWRERGVQVSGPRWPAAYTALEKGGRWYSPWQVRDVCGCVWCSVVCVHASLCVCVFIQLKS